MSKKRGWVDLHHHSEYSLLDGFGAVRQHVERAKELGHPAVAFTEHGTARGFVDIHQQCKDVGVKPVYGIEFYVCRDHTLRGLTEEQKASVTSGLKNREATEAAKRLEDALGLQERRHLCVLAEHEGGLENLFRLNNIANADGFYHKPRIDVPLLIEHGEGLWASSACLGGLLAKSMFEGDFDRVVEDAITLHEGLEGRFSLEIQPHPSEAQARWNRLAIQLHRDLGIPILCTNDTHYVVTEDHYAHDALISLGYKRMLDDPDRIRYIAESFAMKSEDELREAFARNHPDIPSALVERGIDRGAEIGEVCNASIKEPKSVLLPSPPMIEETPEEELKQLCLDGWSYRDIPERAKDNGLTERDYFDRLAHELGVIKKMGFSIYFLIIHDFMNWGRSQGIMFGPGRGSGAGSLVCYLLGITALDPIEHGLLFERFLTPGRRDWPDLDIDVEKQRRHEVFTYLAEKYGEDCVAQMGTFSRMRGRSALRDVARVHGVPGHEVDSVASSIVDGVVRGDSDESSIAEAMHTTPALQAFAERYPDVISDTLALEGHIRHVGIHPAGVICSPVPLGTIVPIERRKSGSEDKLVIGYDMRHVEAVGLVKIDLLGLKTLAILADAVRTIKRRTGEVIDLEKLRFNDQSVFDLFTQRDFAGVFQFDSPSARDACKGVEFTSFEDITSLNAINRPGPSTSGLADDWRAFQSAGKTKEVHPIVDEICVDSYGVMIYQEQIIRVLQRLAGFTPEEAGKMRKIISKSKGAGALREHLSHFVKGAGENGMDARDAEELWTQIEAFGAYGFNKSHAAAYAALAYWGQWLKLYHPLEMFGALLANEGDAGKAGRYAREAARRGIEILPPNANGSSQHWKVDGGAITAGLADIKGVGPRACEEVLAHAPFTSYADLLARVNRQVVNKGVATKLAKSGALRDIVPNPKWLIENLESIVKKVEKSKGWMAKVDGLVAEGESEPKWSEEDQWAMAIEVGVHGRGEHPMGVLKTVDDELLRRTWGSFSHPESGSIVRGIVTTRKVGTSKSKRYCSLEIENELGEKMRIRFDDKGYADNRTVIDLGVGALVACRIGIGISGGIRGMRLYDLLGLRLRWLSDGDLTSDDLILTRDHHPANKMRGSLPNPSWASSGAEEVAVIAGIKVTRTRSTGRPMAFIQLDAGDGPAIEAVVFPDDWVSSSHLEVGDLVDVSVKQDKKKGSYICTSVALI